MNSSLKETLLAVLVLILVGAGVYYWHWLRPEEPTDEGPSTQSPVEACVDKYRQMSEDEFFESLKDKNLSFPNLNSVEEVDERMDQVDRARIGYLICKLKTGGEDFYAKAEDFILNETKTSDETKDYVLGVIEEYRKNPEFKRGLLVELALGDLNEICPEKLPEICLNSGKDIEEEKFIEGCKDVCNKLDQYEVYKNKLESEVINNKDWFDKESDRERQYKMRVAIAYRFGGEEMSLKICDNLSSKESEKCLLSVDYLKGVRCQELRDGIRDLICGS